VRRLLDANVSIIDASRENGFEQMKIWANAQGNE
jgi:hypothetical protein